MRREPPAQIAFARLKLPATRSIEALLPTRSISCIGAPKLWIPPAADMAVYCGARIAPNAIEVPNPMIVVEVLSPSTRRIDVSLKLAGYFRLPSVAHYLIIDPTQRLVIHHARSSGDTIQTRVISDGVIKLDPPGIALAMNDLYGG